MPRRKQGSSTTANKPKSAKQSRAGALPAPEQNAWKDIPDPIPSADHYACAKILMNRFDATPSQKPRDRWSNLGSMQKLLAEPERVIFTLKREGRHDVVASIDEYAKSESLASWWFDWNASEDVQRRQKSQHDALSAWADKIKYAALTIEERALRLVNWAEAPDKPLGHRPPFTNHFPPTVMPTLLELLEGRPGELCIWLYENGHDDTIRVVIDAIEGCVDLEELDARINNPRAYLGWGALPHIPIAIRSGDQSRMGIMRPFMLGAKREGFAVRWAEERRD